MLALGSALTVQGQPSDIFENQSVVIAPSAAFPFVPAVDALNFVNDSGAVWNIATLDLWEPSSTVNFTNRGFIALSPGLDFQTYPADIGMAKRAGNFVNMANGGTNGLIDATGLSLGLLSSSNLLVGLVGNSQIRINATNIVNSGEIDMASSSLMKFNAEDIDMSYGTLSMATPSSFSLVGNGNTLNFVLFNAGILDGYWGAQNDTNTYDPTQLTFGFTPPFQVTNRNYRVFFTQLALTAPLTYQQQTLLDPSNTLWQIVLYQNTDPSISNSVFFDPTEITVQWKYLNTNFFTGVISTNFLYVNDNFGEVTNIGVRLNGSTGGGLRPTYIPRNYTFISGQDFGLFGIPPSPISSITGIIPSLVTNTYAAYEALLNPSVALPSDVPNGDVTNQAGRIEISAEHTLDLTGSQITSLNYLLLSATNQFVGASNAQISSPNLDLYLRTTNGSLSISNIVLPSIPFPEGPIQLWSGRWTNVVVDPITTNTMTNLFHALVVDSQFLPVTFPLVQTLHLGVTNYASVSRNLFISDILNVTRDVLLDTKSLTISTNAPGAITPAGQLNLLSGKIIWSSAAPNLQFFTNFGQFAASNSVFFGGSRTSQSFPFTTTNLPYQAFVNHGSIFDAGSLIWSLYLENEGIFLQPAGSFVLRQNEVAYLTNGFVITQLGDIDIASDNVLVSNHTFQANAAIKLAVTNILSDGVPNLALLPPAQQLTTQVTNGNVWQAGGGLQLTVTPAAGDLLGTTVTCIGQTNAQVPMVWAGEDRGTDNSGFFNNAALGHLILHGLDSTTRFLFSGPSPFGTYALYVDTLEFQGATATTTGPNGDWIDVVLGSNIKIYYAQALANGVSIAEKLNGRNGGRFVWMSGYNYGYFSSSTIVCGGGTRRVNTALAQSTDMFANPCDIPITPWSPGGTDVPTLPGIVLTDPTANPGSNDPGNPLQLGLPPSGSGSGPLSNALVAAQGNYNGLFVDSNGVTVSSSGYFTARTTAKGAYTGKLFVGGKGYTLAGRFDAAGLATNTVTLTSGATVTVNLQLDLTGGDQIRGTVNRAGRWSADLLADRQVYTKAKSLAPSNYTLIIPPDENSTNSPSGFGIGTVKIDSLGNVRWNGTLADGTKVSQSSVLSKAGYWPLYASVYGGAGSTVSWIQATNNELGGRLVWTKLTGAAGNFYPNGFTNSVDVDGQGYAAVAKAAVVSLNSGTGQVIFSGGGLAASVTNSITIDSRNRVSSPAKMSLSITASTGLLKGTAVDPSTGKRFSFQGILSQPENAGAGFFLGNGSAGSVEILSQ